jgi:hypothetical protein
LLMVSKSIAVKLNLIETQKLRSVSACLKTFL